LRAFHVKPDFELRAGPVRIGNQCSLREAFGRVFVLSRADGTLTVLHSGRGSRRVYAFGPDGEPEDVAAADPRTVYVTLRRGTALLRLDLRSGEVEEVVDLSGFADEDGIPDLGMMIIEGNRLFAQIRRYNEDAPLGFAAPGYVAVVDLATEELIDVDASTAGVQAIVLQGTAAKNRMQVVQESHRLYVSATGGPFDEGGIEAIDLDTLESEGLVVRESDGLTGSDLGAFLFTTPDEGFLVYSTDFDLSSHLKPFTLTRGVEEGPDLHVSVGYFVPSLEVDAAGRTLFVPDGHFGQSGIYLFNARSGDRLRPELIEVDGRPTDILLGKTELAGRRKGS
jgi:hypothetical protein